MRTILLTAILLGSSLLAMVPAAQAHVCVGRDPDGPVPDCEFTDEGGIESCLGRDFHLHIVDSHCCSSDNNAYCPNRPILSAMHLFTPSLPIFPGIASLLRI